MDETVSQTQLAFQPEFYFKFLKTVAEFYFEIILYKCKVSAMSDQSDVFVFNTTEGENKFVLNKIFSNFLFEISCFCLEYLHMYHHGPFPNNVLSWKHSNDPNSWKKLFCRHYISCRQCLLPNTQTHPVGRIATYELWWTVPGDQSLQIQIWPARLWGGFIFWTMILFWTCCFFFFKETPALITFFR